VTGAEGDGRLHGFRGDTGEELVGGDGADTMEGLRHFGTILAAGGRLYVAGDGKVYAFTP
jgi:outer membrane protein assembly factor BamB